MHATAWLKAPEKTPAGPVVVLHGGERFLKQAAIAELTRQIVGDDDASVTRFTGKDADFKTVADELKTVSMWGDRRLVLIEAAGDFVTKNRPALEKYLDQPARKSVLVLEVDSWPKNTRLAKALPKVGLELACTELTGGELFRWIADTAKETFGKQIGRDASALLVELAGTTLGLLEQELSKLAAYVGDRDRITAEDVRTLVGGWKVETVWTMVDAIRDGNAGLALQCLDQLLVAGEAPQKILGGISYKLRQYGHAASRARQGKPLSVALQESGVFHRDSGPAAAYMKRLGRRRAEGILRSLLTIDGNLKGNSRLPERLQLEELIVKLSATTPTGR